jgi:1-deoxy-D-xylulose-5-phosphate synthase
MTIFAPSSYQELQQMLHDCLEITDGPSAIRWSKTAAPSVDDDEVGSGLAGRCVRAAEHPETGVCLVGVGKMLANAVAAADLLAAEGIEVTVWDPRCVKPLDPALIADAARHEAVISIEDGFVAGGIGSTLAAALEEEGSPAAVRLLGVPDRYLAHGKPDQILADLGLGADGIAATARSLLA